MNQSIDSSLPLVSIVIPMLNEAGAIERCINSILHQDYPLEKIEIIVVDGLSTDGSREQVQALASKNPNIRLLDNPKKRTPISLNIGARNAKGSVVIILGAHTKIKQDFVRLNIYYMNKLGVKCTGGTQINVGESFFQRAVGLAMGSFFGIPSAPYRFFPKARYVDTVVYAAYKKELFDEIGYFDEELHISEDAEFNWRIRKAGYEIYYTPEIVSYYYPRKTIGKLFKQFFNYGILRVNVIKKHKDAFKLIHIIPPLMLFTFILSLGLSAVMPNMLWPICILSGFYLFYLLGGALYTCASRRAWQYAFILPVIFFIMHISWALGFWVGIFKTYK
ncbi:MAG: glycosyltransferase family 2 protein [candidate division KSB1 bacterium]|nr:glycosyltransferase family 2 protein [candidate division KSB1 bacterium]MDZ7345430.1 glycosyltransferase family 2 protein [candidate division KSB1 bacterium]